MLIAPKTLEKVRRLEETYHARIYTPFAPVACLYWETAEHRRAVPGPAAAWAACPPGTTWGTAWGSAWFKATVMLSPEQARRPVYVTARTGGVEALFWKEGRPAGIFNFDPWIKIRGDHRAQLVAARPEAGRPYELAFEAYAGHPSVGSQPFETLASQQQYPVPFIRRLPR